MGRLSAAVSQTAFGSARGSPCTCLANRTSPCTRLSRMMRAWLESAAADCAPTKSAKNRISRIRGTSLREAMFTPLGDDASLVRRFENEAGYVLGARTHRLAGGCPRQGALHSNDTLRFRRWQALSDKMRVRAMP